MAGCFYQFHLPHIPHIKHSGKSKSLDHLHETGDDMTLLQSHKLPTKLGRLFRSKSEQGLKADNKSSPSNSPKTDGQPRRRLLRVIRDDQSIGEEWENPHVVRRYTKNYWESQMSEAKALQHSSSMPYTVNTDRTILKKTASQSTDSENEGNVSPSIGKHACFKEQVQVIEFADKEKITKHIHYMHEAALLESEEENVADNSNTEEVVVEVGKELKKEAHKEFTRARESLDLCDESDNEKPTDTKLPAVCLGSDDHGPVGSDMSGSDTDEPKKKHKKKKLHIHMPSFLGGGDDHNRDSDSDVNCERRVKRVNKKLKSTYLQAEVDNPEQ